MSTKVSNKRKSGLTVVPVSKDHFSSGSNKSPITSTHVLLTIIDGGGLLASDTFNGKSDPICFVWCGSMPQADTTSSYPDNSFMYTTDEEECIKKGILKTSVCNATLEPIWKEDLIFPLVLADIHSLSLIKLLVYVRDEDIVDETVSYDDLGMFEISIKDIVMTGKTRRQSIVDVNHVYNLTSPQNMKKKAEGFIRVTTTLVFSENDCQHLFSQLGDGINSLDKFVIGLQLHLQGK